MNSSGRRGHRQRHRRSPPRRRAPPGDCSGRAVKVACISCRSVIGCTPRHAGQRRGTARSTCSAATTATSAPAGCPTSLTPRHRHTARWPAVAAHTTAPRGLIRAALSVWSCILPHMTDTWSTRDLPVLRAAVELFERNGRGPRASAIESELGFDEDTVQRALRALYTEPYFEGGVRGGRRVRDRRQADQCCAASRRALAVAGGAARTPRCGT